MNDIDISIPTDVILELQKGLNNGIAANQWWQSLTKEQQNFLLESGFNFLQKQKIKQYQLESEFLIPTLMTLSRSAGTIELFQDNNQVKKLINIDKETNSPMLQQTEELFKLIEDFTEIKEIEFDFKPR